MDKAVRRLVDAVAGARLCYGEPVRQGDRTIIPVSRVHVSGGWGFGRGTKGTRKEPESGTGGGGGGILEARPAGFIELAPEGSRFHEIPDPERAGRLLKTGAAAFTAVVTGLAGARRLRGGAIRGGRRPKGLLRAGR